MYLELPLKNSDPKLKEPPPLAKSVNSKAITKKENFQLLQSRIKILLNSKLALLEFLTELALYRISIVSILVPIPATIGFVVEEAGPLNRLLIVREELGIQLAFKFKFIPLILFIALLVFQCGNIFAFVVNNAVLYMYWMYSWLGHFIAESKSNQKSLTSDGAVNYSQFKMLRLVSKYQTLKIMNTVANQVYADIRLTVHYAGLMVLAVMGIYAGIRFSSKATLLVIVFVAGVVPVVVTFIMYFQVVLFSALEQKAEEMIMSIRPTSVVNSTVSRYLKSCQRIQLGVGYPFFTLCNMSFLIYLERVLGFLADLLLST